MRVLEFPARGKKDRLSVSEDNKGEENEEGLR